MDKTPLLDELKLTVQEQPPRNEYRIVVLVTSAILIAFALVIVALNLYDRGVASQLDLSRPGYQSVRDQAGKDVDIKKFSATGELSLEVFDSFDRQYSEQVNSITKLNAFDSKALTDEALGLPKVSQ